MKSQNGLIRIYFSVVNSVPMVVVDGKIAECRRRGKLNETDLKAAGIGTSLQGNGAHRRSGVNSQILLHYFALHFWRNAFSVMQESEKAVTENR